MYNYQYMTEIQDVADVFWTISIQGAVPPFVL